MEEGIAKERQRSFEEKLRSISKLAALKMSVADIAEILGLDADFVRQEMAKNQARPAEPDLRPNEMACSEVPPRLQAYRESAAGSAVHEVFVGGSESPVTAGGTPAGWQSFCSEV